MPPPRPRLAQIGKFFSRYGEVMDVSLVLNMKKVLDSCAAASRLENQRELLADQLRYFELREWRPGRRGGDGQGGGLLLLCRA